MKILSKGHFYFIHTYFFFDLEGRLAREGKDYFLIVVLCNIKIVLVYTLFPSPLVDPTLLDFSFTAFFPLWYTDCTLHGSAES